MAARQQVPAVSRPSIVFCSRKFGLREGNFNSTQFLRFCRLTKSSCSERDEGIEQYEKTALQQLVRNRKNKRGPDFAPFSLLGDPDGGGAHACIVRKQCQCLVLLGTRREEPRRTETDAHRGDEDLAAATADLVQTGSDLPCASCKRAKPDSGVSMAVPTQDIVLESGSTRLFFFRPERKKETHSLHPSG